MWPDGKFLERDPGYSKKLQFTMTGILIKKCFLTECTAFGRQTCLFPVDQGCCLPETL